MSVPPVPVPAAPASIQSAADTLYVATGGGPLEMASDVAVIVLALGSLALVFVLIRTLAELRRAIRKLGSATEQLGTLAAPVMERGRSIAENADYIVRSVRSEVERLQETVRGVADRIDGAARSVEERAREFEALMDVAQEEAETLFVDTASTVRGVREGARRFTRGDGDREGAVRPDDEGPGEGMSPGETGSWETVSQEVAENETEETP